MTTTTTTEDNKDDNSDNSDSSNKNITNSSSSSSSTHGNKRDKITHWCHVITMKLFCLCRDFVVCMCLFALLFVSFSCLVRMLLWLVTCLSWYVVLLLLRPGWPTQQSQSEVSRAPTTRKGV